MSQMDVITITATGVRKVRAGDAQVVSKCTVQVSGLIGSMTPQTRTVTDGNQTVAAPLYDDCAYTNARTGATSVAGTPITLDGIYTFDVTGQQLAMNVTAVTGTCLLYVTQRLGSGGGVVGSSSSSGLTDAQLRATPVPVSGTVTATGPLTDTQLRASVVPVSVGAALPAGTNNIGDVDVLTLPALPAGTNNIGDVDVLTLPALVAGTAYIGHVGGTQPTVGTEMTRVADANIYAVGDAVNTSTSAPTIITFAGASRVASGTGRIIKARLVTDQAACVAQIRLWLYNVSNPFLNNDNAAFLIKYADKASRIGYIDFPALATEAGSDCAVAQLSAQLMGFTADASSAIYGALETKTIFTPASGQKFYIEFTIDQD